MNMKHLVVAFVVAVVSTSTVQAADVIIPQEVTSEEVVSGVTSSEVVSGVEPVNTIAPAFSWTGFYIGGQIGWSLGDAKELENKSGDEQQNNSNLNSRTLSGFIGGVYAGYDIELGGNLILGADTDIVLSGKKDTKEEEPYTLTTANAPHFKYKLEETKVSFSNEITFKDGDKVTESLTLKEKWSGATRVRIGYALDRMMPYVSGGVAYAQIQDMASIFVEREGRSESTAETIVSGDTLDKTDTLFGYTLGGGVAYAVTDNLVALAEYRYTDFGKSKFVTNALDVEKQSEYSYKTNDFRVGVAFKF
ncbi:outer membrane protein [Bartonella sp. A05]|uniref:outer membrane protein n=1 Tax=Bartonella sp. A05 TaxID=2967261 RepID=UPI0022A9A750|nr:outer membrane protein [Bartonella sp. A05]MCZ2203357.1 porin family protein [Bartonella sp. A05]